MDKNILKQLNDDKHRLKVIISKSKPGAIRDDITDIAGALRLLLIEGGINTSWKNAGMQGSFKINGLHISPELDKICNEFCLAGGVDLDHNIPDRLLETEENLQMVHRSRSGSVNDFGSMVTAKNESTGEREILSPNLQGFTIQIYTNTMLEIDDPLLNSVSTPISLTLDEYMSGIIIKTCGHWLSRRTVLKHKFYTDRIFHNGPRSKPKSTQEEAEAAILDALMNQARAIRDAVEYLYLSISQDVSKSPDAMAFIKRVEELNEANGYKP